ncbi:hypothetical protein DDZ13_06870 [Coraliomargarita sinensis]|uniref:LamB/YcsF family protein n=1 Tax=Coraliomargarita sinensis TaxID=2174842 RepID=A0A317ZFD8_9BACT|nr:LamB/YcsF family protein [Coraliomargarita sinensis]PXA04255.1 hypothetical protein DDZ13_06870 [Coraliomargarita sinensis]
MGRIVINCDLGEDESDERTERLLAQVDAANICCGVHAGSAAKTRRTLQLAAEHAVMVGAHPGMASEGGRGEILPSPGAFRDLLSAQLCDFIAYAESHGVEVEYVKLHGSLYHAVEADHDYADIYLEVLASLELPLGVFALAGGSFKKKAQNAGIRVWAEGFADRAYTSDSRLVARTHRDALLSAEAAIKRFENWQRSQLLDTIDGGAIKLEADTFCVHSDSPDADALLAGLKHLSG